MLRIVEDGDIYVHAKRDDNDNEGTLYTITAQRINI